MNMFTELTDCKLGIDTNNMVNDQIKKIVYGKMGGWVGRGGGGVEGGGVRGRGGGVDRQAVRR